MYPSASQLVIYWASVRMGSPRSGLACLHNVGYQEFQEVGTLFKIQLPIS